MANQPRKRSSARAAPGPDARTAGTHTSPRRAAAPTRNMKAANQAKRTCPATKPRFGLRAGRAASLGEALEGAPTLNPNWPVAGWPSLDRTSQPTV